MLKKILLAPLVLLLVVFAPFAHAAPKIEHWTTANGLRVYYVPAPELPMMDLRLVFDAGSARDGAKPGLAMLANGMLDKGAAGLTEDQLAEQFESIGAVFSSSTSMDMGAVGLRTITLEKEQKAAVDLWLNVLSKPDFPQKDFERVQKLSLVGLQAEKQDPESLGSKALYKALYGDHPYGQPENGTEESIQALNVDDLKAFYQQYYVAKNGLLAIVGAVDRKQAEALAEQVSAVLPTGEPVVVKVQYPGVDEACESDLKQVRLALRLTGVFKINKKLQDKLFAEMQDSLSAELNYKIEAHNLQVFAAFHAPLDSKVIIPKVYPEYSTRRVLTLSEELGDSIETASTWSQELRNELGQRLFRLISQEVFYLHSFHTDPHPGNFAFRPDGSVVVYDYGSTKTLSNEIVTINKQLVQAAFARDIPALEQALVALHVRSDKGEIPEEFYKQWIDILISPLDGQYDFAKNTAHHEAVVMAKKSLKYWDSFLPSAETMMLNRTISGQYWNMISLKVNDNFRPLLEEVVTLQDTASSH